MSENTKTTKKRKSFDKGIEPTNKAKMATFETPKQAKPASKIQSEQKRISKENKNKRKSLPANLINGDGANSPKTKIEPFPGTNDLFKEADEKSKVKPKQVEKKVKDQNEKSKVKNENKIPSAKFLGRKERYIAMRTSAKNKLKQTLLQAAAGEETAVNYLKERVLQLSQRDTLTSSARRKIKMFKKTLKAGGVDVSIFEKDSGKEEIKKVEKENQKTKIQKQGKKEVTKSMEKVNKPKSAKIVKQEKKPTLIKTKDDEVDDDDNEVDDNDDEEDESEVSVTEEEVQAEHEAGDSEDAEESEEEDSDEDEEAEGEDEENDSENSNNLIDMESIEDEDNEEEEEEDDAESKEDSDSDEDDSEDEVPHKKAKISKKPPAENQINKTVSELTKNKSRYVLFVGNLSYNITKEDIMQHFAKIGKLKDVRIPLDKSTNKCKGFAYVELLDQTSYEKALSFHHTNLKGRRINVAYTQAGKKQDDKKKKEIKAKNFKLQAMRQEGKLSGSVKQSQKRAARRNTKRNLNKSN